MVTELSIKTEKRSNIHQGLMQSLLRTVERFLDMRKYVGFEVALKLRLNEPGKPINVFVNEIGRYMTLRAGSSDVHILREILGSSNYVIPESVLVEYRGKRVGVIDLGANIGISSIVLTRQLLRNNIEHSVIAVEPFHRNVEVLKRNLIGHRFTIVEGAVDHTNSEVGLCIPSNPLRESSLIRTGSGITENRVRAFSITDIVSRFPYEVPLFLKIDIEGAEELLFKDPKIKDVLQRCAIVFIEDHTGALSGLPSRYFDAINQTLKDSGLKQNTTNMRDRVYVR